MKKYEKKCYNCGNVDRFTIKEMRNLHFCQRCYKQHDTMCDVFANSVLELEQQNKRYREALERIKDNVPLEFKHKSEYEAKKNVIRLINIQKEVDEALEGEE